jgi:hypothetical protein
MGISSEEIKNTIYLRLNQYGLANSSTNALLNIYLDNVAMELATHDLTELLQTVYTNTDSDGKFTVDGEIVPFAVFANGSKDARHSWQRLSPIDYEYFVNWDSRVHRTGGGMSTRRRYTILPERSVNTETIMQVLEIQDVLPIKVVYYPIRPDISDFPEYAAPLIVNKVLEQYTMDNQESSKDRYVKLLQDQTKKLEKIFLKTSGSIESRGYDTSQRNAKTRDWIVSESNDYGYWR